MARFCFLVSPMTNIPDIAPAVPKKLTPKQQAFVSAYILHRFNATRAAIAAGYSEKSAYSIGSENLKKPEIRAAIDAYFVEGTMSAREVLFHLTLQARGDIGDIWDEVKGGVDWAKARAENKTGLIKRVKRKTTRIVHREDPDEDVIEEEVEFHDPQKALHLLGKELGLFVDKSETKLSGEVEVKKAYQKFSPDDWDE
jgi:phage terminase small subunit